MKTEKLGNIAKINPRPTRAPHPGEIVSFLSMASVSEDGTTSEGEDRPYSEVRTGYTQFLNGDILVAKITPCFENGKIAQAKTKRPIAAGSTEFHVVRPDTSVIDARYLTAYLRQPWIRQAGERRMTGSAGQRRLPADFLAKLDVPIPPLAEQQRVADLLDRADALRTKRQNVLVRLDELAQSIFLEMFGDPAMNPMGWHRAAIGTLLEAPLNYGTMTPAKEDSGDWLCLRVANIKNWSLDLSDRKYVTLDNSTQDRYTVKDDDILLARAIASREHLGKAIVVKPCKERWAFDSHLMRVRLDKRLIEPLYLCHLLRSPGGRRLFLAAARRSAVQYNINTKEFANLVIPVPEIGRQRQFVERLAGIATIRRLSEGQAAEINSLFDSLQARAFRGEL